MANIAPERMDTGDCANGNEEVRQPEVNHTCICESSDNAWNSKIDEISTMLETVPQLVGSELSGSNIGTRQRTLIEEVVAKHVRTIRAELKCLKSLQNELANLRREMVEPLKRRGIESTEDGRDFLRTTDRDSELISEICSFLNTDILQVKGVIKSMCEKEPEKEPLASNGHHERSGPTQYVDWDTVRTRLEATFHGFTGRAKAEAGTSFPSLLRSVACVDPGIFRGTKNENFEEFIRRFKRKYSSLVQGDKALMEILADDHLSGRAKNIYLTLPNCIRARFQRCSGGNEKATRERLDSSQNKLKNLRTRKDQSVADFCLASEKMGSKAGPQSSPEERSLEYAQILLANLVDWPEYVFLMSAVHKATPLTAYDEIKQLAINIEQTKILACTQRPKSVVQRPRWKESSEEKEPTKDWKARYKQYYNSETKNNTIAGGERPERGGLERLDQTPKRVRHERLDQAPQSFSRENARRTQDETRKCYNCLKFGHIGRNCPMRQGQVNQVKGKRSSEENNSDYDNISQIIERVYSRGASALHNGTDQSEMIGKRFLTAIEILGSETEAFIDTGSVVSILSLGVLREAQKRGINVDALERIGSDNIKPVYDASNNKMKFLGVVYVDVALKGGRKSRVPFHISQERGCEVLLGTNALNNLGVSIKISTTQTVKNHEEPKEKANNRVRVVKRTYILAQSSALVTVRCDTNEEETACVLWATKEGVASGVYFIRSQQTTVPINNFNPSPLVLKEGEEVAYWGTEKLGENWSELTHTMMDTENFEPDSNKRRSILHVQIAQNAKDGKVHPLIQKVLDEYSEAFSVCDRELTRTNLAEMTIDTGKNSPLKLKTRPVPLAVRPELRAMLEDLEKRAIIEKSESPWAFPIVLVGKKDGTLRLCVDYRELNKRIVQDSYPLPTMDALLQSLSGKQFFSTLDLCSGYWQIPVAEKDEEKTAFTTPVGLFHFCVTPFGLSTSPPVFQRMMDTLLHGIIGEEVFCYIDDIIICTETEERHVELLKEICARMIAANLRLKAQKCQIMQTEVSFLGHIIDEDGVHMDPEKVKAIEK